MSRSGWCWSAPPGAGWAGEVKFAPGTLVLLDPGGKQRQHELTLIEHEHAWPAPVAMVLPVVLCSKNWLVPPLGLISLSRARLAWHR